MKRKAKARKILLSVLCAVAIVICGFLIIINTKAFKVWAGFVSYPLDIPGIAYEDGNDYILAISYDPYWQPETWEVCSNVQALQDNRKTFEVQHADGERVQLRLPGIDFRLSHIRIYRNGELLETIPFSSAAEFEFGSLEFETITNEQLVMMGA